MSKSTFIRGLQCTKSLFLYKNNYSQRDAISTTQQAIFSRGNAVGLLAQKLFPGGVDASPSSQYKIEESVKKTEDFIAAGKRIIYEAAFQFQGVYVALDVLVKENGNWIAYEVKSSSKITATYIMDAAVQYFVISQSGIKLFDFQLIYVDTNYVMEKKVEPEKFFTKKKILPTILEKQELIKDKIGELKSILEKEILPEVQIGEHCHTPYNCDFLGTCRGLISDDSIFYFNGFSKQQQYDFFKERITKIQDVPADYSFSMEQKVQYEACSHNTTIIKKEEIRFFLEGLKYPHFYLDFEMFMPAIPLYEGTSPYEHIPFLYSIHTKKTKESNTSHSYFLAETGQHPIKSFIYQLIKDLGTEGDILIFDATHERRIINKAIQLFPNLKVQLLGILGRIKDISEPFSKRMFYRKEMKGSYSMKFLLPALAPELSFEKLRIKNGVAALAAFENLQNETDLFKAQESREALIEYCKLDTLGLVKIMEALEKAVEN